MSKDKSEQAYEQSIHRLLNAAPRLVKASRESPFVEGTDPETARLGQIAVDTGSRMLGAVVQLSGVLSNMDTTVRMIKRYPWRDRDISRAKHMELMWFLYQNLIYSFKEKLKLAFNNQKAAAAVMSYERPVWLQFELKQVERELGQIIQDRGNTVHSWSVWHKNLEFLEMVELFANARDVGEKVNLPEGYFDVKGHHQDAKHFVGSDAKAALTVAHDVVYRVLEKHEPRPTFILEKLTDLIDQINSGSARLTERTQQK